MVEKIVCYCKNVSEKSVLNAIKQGASSLKDIQDMTGACTGSECKELNPEKRCCSVDILVLLNKNLVDKKTTCC